MTTPSRNHRLTCILARGERVLTMLTVLVLIVVEAGYVQWLRHMLAVHPSPAEPHTPFMATRTDPEFGLMVFLGVTAAMIGVAATGILRQFRQGPTADAGLVRQVKTAAAYTGMAGLFLLMNEIIR